MISIFAASCRPQNIIPFLDNLAETADDLSSFEVLIKLDEGDDVMIKILDEYHARAPFQLKYLATPKLEGYYTLHEGYNALLKMIDPNTYYCWLLTDEIRLETKGWDTILKKYMHIFPDDIFRLKFSIFQCKNYNDFAECMPCPDNYALTTRKWLEITGGWGDFWGPDSWHQCVDYYLGLCKNDFYPYGIWRSLPVFDIQIKGQEAGQGIVDKKSLKKRARNIFKGWHKHTSHKAQENYFKLAQRLNAHIYAHAMQIKNFELEENVKRKTISLIPTENPSMTTIWKYRIPKLSLKLFIGHKRATYKGLFPFLFYLKSSLGLALYNFIIHVKAVIEIPNNTSPLLIKLFYKPAYNAIVMAKKFKQQLQ